MENDNYYSDTEGDLNISGKKTPKSPSIIKRTVRNTNIVKKRVDEKGQKYINQYCVLKKIGEGSTSVVKVALNVDNKKKYALKIFYKTVLRKRTKIIKNPEGGSTFKNALQDVYREISIMSNLNHNNIIRLHEVIDDEDHDKIYMVIDYAAEGEIIKWDESKCIFYLDPLKYHKKKYLDEEFIRHIFRDCVKGLYYIHLRNIAHRDIKPQNILLDENKVAKICDFGISHLFPSSQDRLDGTEGTYHFMAPESLKLNPDDPGFSGKGADVWSLGITLYCLVYLRLPFYNDNLVIMLNDIQNKPINFLPERKISLELKNFFTLILDKNPSKRISLQNIAAHPWINQLSSPLSYELKKFVAKQESDRILIPISTIVFMKSLARKLVKRIRELPLLKLQINRSFRKSISEGDLGAEIFESIDRNKRFTISKPLSKNYLQDSPFDNDDPYRYQFIKKI